MRKARTWFAASRMWAVLSVGALALGTLTFGATSTAWANPAAFAPFFGEYVLVAPPEAKQLIKQAIEEGTEDMGPLRRRIGRKRLKAVNPAYQVVRIYEQNGMIVTDFDGKQYVAPSDGTPQRGTDPQGKRVDVSYRVEGRALHGRYVGEDGEKRIDFELGPEGRSMTYSVTLMSGQLPAPITYAIQYERR